MLAKKSEDVLNMSKFVLDDGTVMGHKLQQAGQIYCHWTDVLAILLKNDSSICIIICFCYKNKSTKKMGRVVEAWRTICQLQFFKLASVSPLN